MHSNKMLISFILLIRSDIFGMAMESTNNEAQNIGISTFQTVEDIDNQSMCTSVKKSHTIHNKLDKIQTFDNSAAMTVLELGTTNMFEKPQEALQQNSNSKPRIEIEERCLSFDEARKKMMEHISPNKKLFPLREKPTVKLRQDWKRSDLDTEDEKMTASNECSQTEEDGRGMQKDKMPDIDVAWEAEFDKMKEKHSFCMDVEAGEDQMTASPENLQTEIDEHERGQISRTEEDIEKDQMVATTESLQTEDEDQWIHATFSIGRGMDKETMLDIDATSETEFDKIKGSLSFYMDLQAEVDQMNTNTESLQTEIDKQEGGQIFCTQEDIENDRMTASTESLQTEDEDQWLPAMFSLWRGIDKETMLNINVTSEDEFDKTKKEYSFCTDVEAGEDQLTASTERLQTEIDDLEEDPKMDRKDDIIDAFQIVTCKDKQQDEFAVEVNTEHDQRENIVATLNIAERDDKLQDQFNSQEDTQHRRTSSIDECLQSETDQKELDDGPSGPDFSSSHLQIEFGNNDLATENDLDKRHQFALQEIDTANDRIIDTTCILGREENDEKHKDHKKVDKAQKHKALGKDSIVRTNKNDKSQDIHSTGEEGATGGKQNIEVAGASHQTKHKKKKRNCLMQWLAALLQALNIFGLNRHLDTYPSKTTPVTNGTEVDQEYNSMSLWDSIDTNNLLDETVDNNETSNAIGGQGATPIQTIPSENKQYDTEKQTGSEYKASSERDTDHVVP